MTGPKGDDFTPAGTASGLTRAQDWWGRHSAEIIQAVVLVDAVEAIAAAAGFALWAWERVSPTVGIAAAGVEAQTAVVAAALFGHWLTHFRKTTADEAPGAVPVGARASKRSVIDLPADEPAEESKGH